MQGDEYTVAGHLEILLDVVGSKPEREVVGGDRVLRGMPRSSPVADVEYRRVVWSRSTCEGIQDA